MLHHHIRELGGAEIDLFAAVARAEPLARRLADGGMTGPRAHREAARQVVCAALIVAIREGRPSAADQLVKITFDDLFRWCRYHGRRGVSAEDLTHDALVRMLDQLPKLRDPDRFRPWMWGVAWRVLKESERRTRWRRWLPAAAQLGADLEQDVHTAERVAKVGEVLERLTTEDRALLFLAYVEELGRKDIAQQLSIAEGTLNRRLTAARAAFAEVAVSVGLDGNGSLPCAWEDR